MLAKLGIKIQGSIPREDQRPAARMVNEHFKEKHCIDQINR